MSVCPQRDTERPSQSEICELQVSFRVDEEILRLQIAVQDAMCVAVVKAFHELIREFLWQGKSVH